jgi:hypothetical protein
VWSETMKRSQWMAKPQARPQRRSDREGFHWPADHCQTSKEDGSAGLVLCLLRLPPLFANSKIARRFLNELGKKNGAVLTVCFVWMVLFV